MPPAFLAVFSEPGQQVTLEEFQDWYNNEHVPLRLNHLPAFLTGARYSASDSLKPSWLAVYDIDDTTTFGRESYTSLRANRSAREAALIQRLETLDRRTYEVAYDTGESPSTTSLALPQPTRFLVTHGVDIDSASEPFNFLRDWVLERTSPLADQGWARTRVLRLIDNLRTGASVGSAPEEQIVPNYLMVHEFLTVKSNLLLHDAVSQPQSHAKVSEYRTWELYRAYPCLAQGNIDAHSA